MFNQTEKDERLDNYVYGKTVADFLFNLEGDLLDRFQPHNDWWEARYAHGVDPYSKASNGPILAECQATDRKGKLVHGINLASQDYLALASHPHIKKVAKEAVEQYGVHSAGSPALMGNTAVSIQLAHRLAKFLQMENCTLFPTGWAAGYGTVRCLVGENDHVVIDSLAHACLAEGARSATRNVHRYPHLSLSALERKLKQIRSSTATAGILIVTESLFSMDSDTPDIQGHQALANRYGATLMVDVAHDMGCLGKTGRGFLEEQGMLGKVDIVMGSFSKTFASNGGFVASNHPALKLALNYGSNPLTFSNAISPVQAAIVLATLDVIESEEGAHLRHCLMDNAIYLRQLLAENQFKLLGNPSAIVPVLLGDVKKSRLITHHTMENDAIINLVEYPAVSRKNSRFRLQVMASHTNTQLKQFVSILDQARTTSEQLLNNNFADEQENDAHLSMLAS